MSWLTDLVGKSTNKTTTAVDEQIMQKHLNDKKTLYLSVNFTEVKFLGIDEGVSPHKILFWKEVSTGPYENLEIGLPVKNIYDVLTKILADNKQILDEYANFAVALSGEGVFFRTIDVPKLESADMQKLVLGEIKKTLPVDFSEVLFAQNDLGEKNENIKTFFCVLIQKSMFENMKAVFGKYNLDPYFEIEMFSLARIVTRDENYKLVLYVGKNSTYIVFLQGQIIQEVIMLEFGDSKIDKEMQNTLKFDLGQVNLLRENHAKLKDEGRLGGQIIEEFVEDFNRILSKSVTLHILEFEKKYKCEIKELLICGNFVSQKLKKNIHDEFDAEMSVDFVSEKNFDAFVAENFLESDLKRYAQCFGLAKRAK